jgi:hypothetical protein
MLKNFLLCFVSCLIILQSCATQQPTKKIEKSISIEYAYDEIDKDDAYGQLNLSKSRYLIYGDANFLVIKNYINSPMPNSMDAIEKEYIKDLKSGKVYFCMKVGNDKIRMIEPDSSLEYLQIFDTYSDSTYALSKVESPSQKIQNNDVQQWQLNKEGFISPLLYLTQTFAENDLIKKLPIALYRYNKFVGLCLGNDRNISKYTYKLRAQKIEIDRVQPIGEHLASFKDSDKAEFNKLISAFIGF